MLKRMSRVACLLVVLVGLAFVGGGSTVVADDASVDVNSPEVMKAMLEPQIGKRVKMKLCSGQDVEGKVVKVGTHAVRLTELVGMELFDATVKLNEIAAVIVRGRSE